MDRAMAKGVQYHQATQYIRLSSARARGGSDACIGISTAGRSRPDYHLSNGLIHGGRSHNDSVSAQNPIQGYTFTDCLAM